MPSKPEPYPAVYMIFTLLNTIRRGVERKNIWREFRRQKVALQPRLAFWLALCEQAGLITEYENKLRVARHTRRWLNKSLEEQTFHLMEAWQNAPKNLKARQFRKKLLWKLRYDQPLTQKDLGAIYGLEALGLVSGGQLTKWGRFFIKGEAGLPSPKPVQACRIDRDRFVASLPEHTDLLWELEKHLSPDSPGRYPLSGKAMNPATPPEVLIQILERGLQNPLPGEIKARLLDQPSLRMSEGFILEFSHPEQVRRLRRQPALRPYLEEFLSPRHILVSARNAPVLFKMLKRRGVHLENHEEAPQPIKKRTHFPLNPMLQPVGQTVPKLEILKQYQRWQQALDVFYRAPGYPAEKRRITPLSIEERGGNTYVVAYCQTRRAQRLFRLDRMEIPGTW